MANQVASAFRKLGVRSRGELAARLFGTPLHACAQAPIAQRKPVPASWNDLARLTDREREVMLHAARVRSNKVIACALGLSVSAVGAYLNRAAKKLDIDSRAALVRTYFDSGAQSIDSAATK